MSYPVEEQSWLSQILSMDIMLKCQDITLAMPINLMIYIHGCVSLCIYIWLYRYTKLFRIFCFGHVLMHVCGVCILVCAGAYVQRPEKESRCPAPSFFALFS